MIWNLVAIFLRNHYHSASFNLLSFQFAIFTLPYIFRILKSSSTAFFQVILLHGHTDLSVGCIMQSPVGSWQGQGNTDWSVSWTKPKLWPISWAIIVPTRAGCVLASCKYMLSQVSSLHVYSQLKVTFTVKHFITQLSYAIYCYTQYTQKIQ